MASICPACGTPYALDARFCGECGTTVSAPAAASGDETLLEMGVEDTLPRGSKVSDVAAPASVAAAPAIPPTSVQAGAAEPAGLPRTPDELIGRTLSGRYQVLRKIGSGGFGAVFEALQIQTGRSVALKVLYPHMTRDASLVARFRREAKTAASLRDAHTVITYDFDETPEGVLFIAMELLTGRSLHDELKDAIRLDAPRALHVVDQMCSSLAEAHLAGIVHRDIKPENVMLEDRPGEPDYVKVLDFGIAKIMQGEVGAETAKLTAMGQTVGTLEYMSPEQLAGEPLDGRSDIYSMGVMLYQMITGRLPWIGPPTVIIDGHMNKAPTPPRSIVDAIPPAVEAMILRCMAKETADRYADVVSLRADARRLLAELTASATAPAQSSVAAAASAPQVAAPPPAPAPMGSAPMGSGSAGAAAHAAGPHAPRPKRSGAAAGSRTGLYIGVGAAALVGIVALVVGLAVGLGGSGDGGGDGDPAGVGSAGAAGGDGELSSLLRFAAPNAKVVQVYFRKRFIATTGRNLRHISPLTLSTLLQSSSPLTRIERVLIVAPRAQSRLLFGLVSHHLLVVESVNGAGVASFLKAQGMQVREHAGTPVYTANAVSAAVVGDKLVGGSPALVRAGLTHYASNVAKRFGTHHVLGGGKTLLFARHALNRVPLVTLRAALGLRATPAATFAYGALTASGARNLSVRAALECKDEATAKLIADKLHALARALASGQPRPGCAFAQVLCFLTSRAKIVASGRFVKGQATLDPAAFARMWSLAQGAGGGGTGVPTSPGNMFEPTP